MFGREDDVSLATDLASSLSSLLPATTTIRLMDVSGDEIAEAVLKQFDELPAKAKPLARGGGVKEWVPLSGIVAQGNS